jgi:hypothetical protein
MFEGQEFLSFIYESLLFTLPKSLILFPHEEGKFGATGNSECREDLISKSLPPTPLSGRE